MLNPVVPDQMKSNTGDKVNLRLTRRSGSAGVAGSSYSFIVLFGLRFISHTCNVSQPAAHEQHIRTHLAFTTLPQLAHILAVRVRSK